MKKNLLLIFLLSSILMSAQQQNIRNWISFSYDNSGNQTQRTICVNCNSYNPYGRSVDKTQTEDLVTADSPDSSTKISYYPNPVKEELHIQWELEENNFVTAVEVYSVSGQLLQNYPSPKEVKTATIGFENYSQGYYIVVVRYNNGGQKSLQIVKE